eukprot:2875648-Lingulodinium_polyedra.AAC.1
MLVLAAAPTRLQTVRLPPGASVRRPAQACAAQRRPTRGEHHPLQGRAGVPAPVCAVAYPGRPGGRDPEPAGTAAARL